MSAPNSVQYYVNRALPLELEMRVDEEDADDPDEAEDYDDSQEEIMPVPVEVTITPCEEEFQAKEEGDSVDSSTLHEEVDIKEEEEDANEEVLQPPLEVNIKEEPREDEEIVEGSASPPYDASGGGIEKDVNEDETTPDFSSVIVDVEEGHNSEEEILPHAAMVVVPEHGNEYPEGFVEENVPMKNQLRRVRRQKIGSKRASTHNIVDKIYRCKDCSMCYASEEFLKQHVPNCRSRAKFGRVDTVYRCPNCSLCYTSPEYLAGHVRRGCRYRPTPIKNAYLCVICGEGFNNYGHLYQHKRQKHSNGHSAAGEPVPDTSPKPSKIAKFPTAGQNARNFQCPNCPRAFTAPGYLVQHQRSHVRQQTDHSCDLCGEDFRNKLRTEVETHFTEKHSSKDMHRCAHCDRIYGQKQNLVTHLQTHGEYECFVCNVQFPSQQLLTEHFRTHATANQPFECDICHRIYWQQGRYYEHRLKAHNIKPNSTPKGNVRNKSVRVITHTSEKAVVDDDDDEVQVVSVVKSSKN